MSGLDPWLRFVLTALGCWRVSHLLASEDGPWDLVFRLRRSLGASFFGRLMDCFYCVSLWVAAPLAFYVADTLIDRVVAWLAVSGAACLLNRLDREPVRLEAWDAAASDEPRS